MRHGTRVACRGIQVGKWPAALVVLLFFAALLAIPTLGLAAGSWIDQNAGIEDATLRSADFVDASHGWAVGWRDSDQTGVVVKTSDGGAHWTPQTVGIPGGDVYLHSVTFADTGHGWAAGSRVDNVDGNVPVILATSDGGAHWTSQDPGTAITNVHAVSFADSSHGWAVGNRGDGADGDDDNEAAIVATSDGGAHWVPQTIPVGSGTLNSVAFADALHGWAVGERTVNGVTSGVILATADGGSHWVLQSLPANVHRLSSVSFIDTMHGWAVGDWLDRTDWSSGDIILTTTDGGAHWSASTAGTPGALYSVTFASTTHGWAVGQDGPDGRGLLVATTDGGAHWVAEPLTQELYSGGAYLFGVASVATTETTRVWAVGNGGSVAAYQGGPIPVVVPPSPTYARFAGTDRFATAIKTSQSVFSSGSCNAVVIATGMNYPDALSGAGLAGAANAPILLVSGDVLRADVKAEIKRVTQGKATYKVYILGSTAAVTAKMESSIKASLTGESVQRFSGGNRYQTAQLVAAKVKALQGASFGNKAILVTGLDYVDGLLVGPAAFTAKAPILLVGTTVDAGLKSTLKSLGTKDLVVLGTTARVPVAIETSLKSGVPGLTTRRASNLTDTYARSAAAAEFFASPVNGFGLTWSGIGIVTAEKFPDGLGAGCVEGKLKTSLLLTKSTSLPSTISAKITAHKATIKSVRFYGSVAAVSGPVETSVRNLLK